MGFVFVAHVKRTWKWCMVSQHEGWTLVDCAFAQWLVIGLERIVAIIVHWAQHHSCLDFKLRSSLYNCFLIFPIISYQFQFFLQLGQISNKLHELQMLLPFVCNNNFVCEKNNKKHTNTNTNKHYAQIDTHKLWPVMNTDKRSHEMPASKLVAGEVGQMNLMTILISHQHVFQFVIW